MRATEELRKMRLDGMTDRAIARALLAAERGMEPASVAEEEIDHVLEQYLLNLERECAAKAYEAIPGVAAIANAVANAIGVRVPSVPCTPDRVLAALNGRRNEYAKL